MNEYKITVDGGLFAIETEILIKDISIELVKAPSDNVFKVNSNTLRISHSCIGGSSSSSSSSKIISDSIIRVENEGSLYLNDVTFQHITLKGENKKGGYIYIDGTNNPNYISYLNGLCSYVNVNAEEGAIAARYYIISNPDKDNNIDIIKDKVIKLGRLSSLNQGIVRIGGEDKDLYKILSPSSYIFSSDSQVTCISISLCTLKEVCDEATQLKLESVLLKICDNEEYKGIGNEKEKENKMKHFKIILGPSLFNAAFSFIETHIITNDSTNCAIHAEEIFNYLTKEYNNLKMKSNNEECSVIDELELRILDNFFFWGNLGYYLRKLCQICVHLNNISEEVNRDNNENGIYIDGAHSEKDNFNEMINRLRTLQQCVEIKFKDYRPNKFKDYKEIIECDINTFKTQILPISQAEDINPSSFEMHKSFYQQIIPTYDTNIKVMFSQLEKCRSSSSPPTSEGLLPTPELFHPTPEALLPTPGELNPSSFEYRSSSVHFPVCHTFPDSSSSSSSSSSSRDMDESKLSEAHAPVYYNNHLLVYIHGAKDIEICPDVCDNCIGTFIQCLFCNKLFLDLHSSCIRDKCEYCPKDFSSFERYFVIEPEKLNKNNFQTVTLNVDSFNIVYDKNTEEVSLELSSVLRENKLCSGNNPSGSSDDDDGGGDSDSSSRSSSRKSKKEGGMSPASKNKGKLMNDDHSPPRKENNTNTEGNSDSFKNAQSTMMKQALNKKSTADKYGYFDGPSLTSGFEKSFEINVKIPGNYIRSEILNMNDILDIDLPSLLMMESDGDDVSDDCLYNSEIFISDRNNKDDDFTPLYNYYSPGNPSNSVSRIVTENETTVINPRMAIAINNIILQRKDKAVWGVPEHPMYSSYATSKTDSSILSPDYTLFTYPENVNATRSTYQGEPDQIVTIIEEKQDDSFDKKESIAQLMGYMRMIMDDNHARQYLYGILLSPSFFRIVYFERVPGMDNNYYRRYKTVKMSMHGGGFYYFRQFLLQDLSFFGVYNYINIPPLIKRRLSFIPAKGLSYCVGRAAYIYNYDRSPLYERIEENEKEDIDDDYSVVSKCLRECYRNNIIKEVYLSYLMVLYEEYNNKDKNSTNAGNNSKESNNNNNNKVYLRAREYKDITKDELRTLPFDISFIKRQINMHPLGNTLLEILKIKDYSNVHNVFSFYLSLSIICDSIFLDIEKLKSGILKEESITTKKLYGYLSILSGVVDDMSRMLIFANRVIERGELMSSFGAKYYNTLNSFMDAKNSLEEYLNKSNKNTSKDSCSSSSSSSDNNNNNKSNSSPVSDPKEILNKLKKMHTDYNTITDYINNLNIDNFKPDCINNTNSLDLKVMDLIPVLDQILKLSSLSLCHRDISLTNILIKEKKNINGNNKIEKRGYLIDYGGVCHAYRREEFFGNYYFASQSILYQLESKDINYAVRQENNERNFFIFTPSDDLIAFMKLCLFPLFNRSLQNNIIISKGRFNIKNMIHIWDCLHIEDYLSFGLFFHILSHPSFITSLQPPPEEDDKYKSYNLSDKEYTKDIIISQRIAEKVFGLLHFNNDCNVGLTFEETLKFEEETEEKKDKEELVDEPGKALQAKAAKSSEIKNEGVILTPTNSSYSKSTLTSSPDVNSFAEKYNAVLYYMLSLKNSFSSDINNNNNNNDLLFIKRIIKCCPFIHLIFSLMIKDDNNNNNNNNMDISSCEYDKDESLDKIFGSSSSSSSDDKSNSTSSIDSLSSLTLLSSDGKEKEEKVNLHSLLCYCFIFYSFSTTTISSTCDNTSSSSSSSSVTVKYNKKDRIIKRIFLCYRAIEGEKSKPMIDIVNNLLKNKELNEEYNKYLLYIRYLIDIDVGIIVDNAKLIMELTNKEKLIKELSKNKDENSLELCKDRIQTSIDECLSAIKKCFNTMKIVSSVKTIRKIMDSLTEAISRISERNTVVFSRAHFEIIKRLSEYDVPVEEKDMKKDVKKEEGKEKEEKETVEEN